MAETNSKAVSGEFLDSLVEDLRPVRPVRLGGICALALLGQALFVAAAAVWMGVGAASLARLADGFFLFVLATLVVAAGAATWLAARASIPGRYVSPVHKFLLPALPIVLALLVVSVAPWGADFGEVGPYIAKGMPCTRTIASIALPVWLATVLLLRALAPLDIASTGLFAGLSALAQGAVVMQLACPKGDAYHLAVGHFVPITILALVAAAASSAVLRRRR